MEEDILLDMYRNTYDAFLESYKVKMNQNEELIKLCGDLIDVVAKTKAPKYKEQLGRILEI